VVASRPAPPAPTTPEFGTLRVLAAWGVHLYTASGVVLALLALRAVGEERFYDTFRWLTVAMAIDCSDGTLARAVQVKRVLPWFDGTKLDDIVDYLTYVFVPIVLLYEGGFLPPPAPGLLAAAPLLASAYGFNRTDAKTGDHYFRGFPSYWNVFAFYVVALGLSPTAIGVWLVALSVLVFAPLKFLYPSRAPRHRTLSIGLGLVWAAVMIVALWLGPAAPKSVLWASLAYPVYYVGMSLWLQWQER
jgi:phosphatidylcholine synthase